MSTLHFPRRIAALVCVGAVLAAPVAAWASQPRGGGQYDGHTTRAGTHYQGTITFTVASDRAHFVKGTVWVYMHGSHKGRGSCVGPGYFTLGPIHARQISTHGTFDLSGTFMFTVVSKSHSVKYDGRATITGKFTASGKRVSGTAEEWASRKGISCASGLVHYSAKLVTGD